MKWQRNSKQRDLILKTVAMRCDHPTADQIYMQVRAQNDKISRGTVYRNLNLLSESGDVLHVKVPSADRYDSRRELHYHIQCTSCGKVSDVPILYKQEWDDGLSLKTGFSNIRHITLFEGICEDCIQNTKQKAIS